MSEDKKTHEQYQKLIEELFQGDTPKKVSTSKKMPLPKADDIIYKHLNKCEILQDFIQHSLPRLGKKEESSKLLAKIEAELDAEEERFKVEFANDNERAHKNLKKIFNDFFNS